MWGHWRPWSRTQSRGGTFLLESAAGTKALWYWGCEAGETPGKQMWALGKGRPHGPGGPTEHLNTGAKEQAMPARQQHNLPQNTSYARRGHLGRDKPEGPQLGAQSRTLACPPSVTEMAGRPLPLPPVSCCLDWGHLATSRARAGHRGLAGGGQQAPASSGDLPV